MGGSGGFMPGPGVGPPGMGGPPPPPPSMASMSSTPLAPVFLGADLTVLLFDGFFLFLPVLAGGIFAMCHLFR